MMLASAGCAAEPSAVLEVALQVEASALPAAWSRPDESLFLFVQFRPATPSWELGAPWLADPNDPPAFPLPNRSECAADAERCRATFSVVTSEPETTGLRIKARFCPGTSVATGRCQEVDETLESSAYHFELSRPFYPGRRTWWNARLSAIPSPRPAASIPVVQVSPCEVAGCSEDAGWIWTEGGRDFCLRSTGEHFCEAP